MGFARRRVKKATENTGILALTMALGIALGWIYFANCGFSPTQGRWPAINNAKYYYQKKEKKPPKGLLRGPYGATFPVSRAAGQKS